MGSEEEGEGFRHLRRVGAHGRDATQRNAPLPDASILASSRKVPTAAPAATAPTTAAVGPTAAPTTAASTGLAVLCPFVVPLGLSSSVFETHTAACLPCDERPFLFSMSRRCCVLCEIL